MKNIMKICIKYVIMSKVTKFRIIELLRKESAFISHHFQQNYDVI